MRCAMVVTAAKLGRLTNRVRSEERAILQATGVPKPMKIKKLKTRIQIAMSSIGYFLNGVSL
jgi:hypothetical protein